MDLRHRLLHLLSKLHPPRRPATPPIHRPRRRHTRIPLQRTALQPRRRQRLHTTRPSSRAPPQLPPHGYSQAETRRAKRLSLWMARGRWRGRISPVSLLHVWEGSGGGWERGGADWGVGLTRVRGRGRGAKNRARGELVSVYEVVGVGLYEHPLLRRRQ